MYVFTVALYQFDKSTSGLLTFFSNRLCHPVFIKIQSDSLVRRPRIVVPIHCKSFVHSTLFMKIYTRLDVRVKMLHKMKFERKSIKCRQQWPSGNTRSKSIEKFYYNFAVSIHCTRPTCYYVRQRERRISLFETRMQAMFDLHRIHRTHRLRK